MSAFSPETHARAILPKELLAEASALHLCIHIHPQRVSVALAEASSTKILWSENFEIELRHAEPFQDAVDFVVARNWAERVFRKCTLTFDTGHFTLVPAAFFSKEKEQSLLEFHLGRKPANTFTASIDELRAEMIYETDNHLLSLAAKFPNVRIFPISHLLTRHAFQNSVKEEDAIYLCHHFQSLVLIVFKGRQLMLLNNYEAKGEEDVLYFTANAAMQFDIDLEHAIIKCYSTELQSTETLQLLKNYCRAMEVIATPDDSSQSILTYLHLKCA